MNIRNATKTINLWYNKYMKENGNKKGVGSGNGENSKATQFKSGDEWVDTGGGRPLGSISPITKLKQYFRDNPDDYDEYLKRYRMNPANEKHVMEMIDGKPKQSTDITSGGEVLPVLVEIINERTKDNTNTEGVE